MNIINCNSILNILLELDSHMSDDDKWIYAGKLISKINAQGQN